MTTLLTSVVCAFIDRPLHGVLATYGRTGKISQSVVWYRRERQTVWLSCDQESVKVRHIRNDERVSLLILAPHGGAYVRFDATASIEGQVTPDQRLQLVAPHLGADAQHWVNEHPLDRPQALIRLVPLHVVSSGVA